MSLIVLFQKKKKQAGYSESGGKSKNTWSRSCKSDDAQVCGSIHLKISFVFMFFAFLHMPDFYMMTEKNELYQDILIHS